ncbi:MAG: ribosome biogenesis GTP-binding protein YihA/YsxC [Bacillota bacterium]
MMITSVKNPLLAAEPKGYPEARYPEFCIMGRSNVGKSSFINALLNRKKLAYTSQNPGKTQTINFYLINDDFYFVDVPGYGYAKVSKQKREAFGKMIETYLTERETLKHVFLLIDSRHEPTKDDYLMVEFLQYIRIPFTIVATKADKLSKNQQQAHLSKLNKQLMLDSYTDVILFSAVTKQNRDLILENIIRIADNKA